MFKDNNKQLTQVRQENVIIESLAKMDTSANSVAQHGCCECLDFHEVSTSVGDLNLQEKVWQVLSLIGSL